MRPLILALLLLGLLLPGRSRAASPLPVVAAENMYGDIARQIGGDAVAVTSILSNPDQDPHLFETSPSAARLIARARIVIDNGIGYDPWMSKLLAATPAAGRSTITVAALIGRKPGDNPHLWYDPAAIQALARTLAADLSRLDPAHRAGYRQRLAQFQASMQPVLARIAALRARFAGTPVTATEPVFNEMFAALGMKVRNLRFQIAVMNDTEPGARTIATFQDALKRHRVKLLVYNSQATGPLARRMATLARQAHIPVVAVTETEPPGLTYQAWMLRELDAVDQALTR